MSTALLLAIFLLQTPVANVPVTLNVRHEHRIGGCDGKLIFSDQGVRFETKEKNESRSWTYPDVKYFEIVSEQEVEIHSYENHGVEQLGRDKDYTFHLQSGAITDELYQLLVQKSPRAVVTHVVFHSTQIVQEIPVRHRHTFGGCQGTLTIATDKVIYRASDKDNSRIWMLTDIQSFASSEPFSLRLSTAFETFTFDLKLPFAQTSYDVLWNAVYTPKIQTYRR
jgi:hypothetical protein